MPNMENFYYDVYGNRSKQVYLQNEASAREIATCKQNVGQIEDFMAIKFSDGYKSTMD
jgi:hypothetical protein